MKPLQWDTLYLGDADCYPKDADGYPQDTNGYPEKEAAPALAAINAPGREMAAKTKNGADLLDDALAVPLRESVALARARSAEPPAAGQTQSKFSSPNSAVHDSPVERRYKS